jgi:hypothetical protein
MCSICWEETKERSILLQKNVFSDSEKKYTMNCLCNISIHKSCMNQWISMNKSCPICHKSLKEHLSVSSIIIKGIKYVYSLCIRVILSFFLLHILVIFYLLYFVKLYYEIKELYFLVVKYL